MKLEGMPRPLTEEEADEVLRNTLREIDTGGLWDKLCAACGEYIGGKLARYGKPTPTDLQYCMCPRCGAVGRVKLQYWPPDGGDHVFQSIRAGG